MKAEVRAIYIISALESDVNGLELHKYLTRLDIAGLCDFLFVCLFGDNFSVITVLSVLETTL